MLRMVAARAGHDPRGMSTLDALCAAVATWVPFVVPALLLVWFESLPPATTRHAFIRTMDLAGISLAITTRGWYAAPDYAGSPVAALSTAALEIVPALLALAIVHRAASEEGRNRRDRIFYSLGVSYGVVVCMLVPAMLLFVRLGGDTL